MNWVRSFLPNRISGQIAILIAISLIVIHLVLTVSFLLSRRDRPFEHSPEQVATLVELVAAVAVPYEGLVAPGREIQLEQLGGARHRHGMGAHDARPFPAAGTPVELVGDRTGGE